MRTEQGDWADRESAVPIGWVWHSLIVHKRWVMIGFVVGLLLGILWVMLAPKRYQAEAKLEVESAGGVPTSLGGLSALIGGGSPNANAQVEILLSRPVLEQVQQKVALSEPYEQFAKRFKAEPVKNTSLIQVSALAETPERSAELANLWTETYLAHVRDLYARNPSILVSKLEDELNQQERAIHQISQRLVAFLKQKQLVVPDKEMEKAIENYVALQTQLLEQQGQVQALARQIADLQANLQQVPEYYEAGRNLAIPPEVQAISTRIAELEIERRAKLEEFQPTAPEVQLIEAQIAQAREEREKILRNAIDSQFAVLSRQQAVNPLYQGMLEALWKAKVEKNAREVTAGLLAKQVGELETRFRRMPELLAEYGDLRRQYETAVVLWTEKIKAYEQARAQQLMGKVLPIVIEPAAPPVRPISPRPVLYTTATTAAGVLFGILMALAFAFRDRRVRTRWDVERLLGVPVLAELPSNPSPQQVQFVMWALRAWGGGTVWHTVLALPMEGAPTAVDTAYALTRLMPAHEALPSPSQENLPVPSQNGVFQVKVASHSEEGKASLADAERLLLIIPKGHTFDERLLLTLQQAQPQIVGAVLVDAQEGSR